MNQETRNKKNKKYQANLERRNGITKKDDYIKMVSDGIEKYDGPNPMCSMNEYVTTRNKYGKVITRLKSTYKWTAQAKAIQKLYHETKNGIPPQVKKPIETKPKPSKEERLKTREFSKFHKDLVAGLYENNKQQRIIKQAEQKAKHEEKIKKLMNELAIKKSQKPSFKLFKKTKKNNTSETETLNIAA